MAALVTCHCVTRRSSVEAVDLSGIVSLALQIVLNGCDRRVRSRDAVIAVLTVIIRRNIGVVTRVVIKRVIIVGVVGIVVPGIDSLIQADPCRTIPAPPMTAPEMCTTSVPIVMPVCVTPGVDVTARWLSRMIKGRTAINKRVPIKGCIASDKRVATRNR